MKKQTRGELVTAATNDVRVFFFHFFCEKCSKMKKSFFFQKHPHPHPRHSTCSALASWASSGSVPLGKATIPPFILSVSLCVLLSQSLSISYPTLRLLVRACRQEELHGGGVTVERGLNESRPVILYMRGKRRWRME